MPKPLPPEVKDSIPSLSNTLPHHETVTRHQRFLGPVIMHKGNVKRCQDHAVILFQVLAGFSNRIR